MYKFLSLLLSLFCVKALIAEDSIPSQSMNIQSNIIQDRNKEVYIVEGGVFLLGKGDANFTMYGDSYALLPLSNALKFFLNNNGTLKLDMQTLRSYKSTTQIYKQGDEILFYYSKTKDSDLYSRIAPKSFKLTLEEYSDESREPREVFHIYRIHNFDEAILYSPCYIIKSKHFIRDRKQSEMLINLDTNINPRLLTQLKNELILECSFEDIM